MKNHSLNLGIKIENNRHNKITKSILFLETTIPINKNQIQLFIRNLLCLVLNRKGTSMLPKESTKFAYEILSDDSYILFNNVIFT